MKTIVRIVSVVLLMAALFAVGYSWRDLSQGRLPSSATLAALSGSGGLSTKEAESLTFKKAFGKILADFYKPVKAKEVKFAAMEGLMASLGDPHTIFMEPRTAAAFSLETTANFVGIGAKLSPDPLGARVMVVFEDSPANRAGVRVGDVVTGVDGVKVTGKDVDDIVSKIRGKEGTVVRLELLRQGSAKPVQIRATRRQIITPTVEGAIIPGSQFGRIAISTFSEPTAEQFDRIIAKLEKASIKGLVIDLRNNPGGLLETAVELLSRFVEDKVVVKMRGRNGHEEVAKSFVGLERNWAYPIVVLLNEDSASASEILAGCMRDYKLATLVGEHSYGKASVQNVRPLRDGASAKITIARYFLPSGEDIGRTVDEDGQYVTGGIRPDVLVDNDPDIVSIFGDPKTDRQLQKAMQVLKSKM